MVITGMHFTRYQITQRIKFYKKKIQNLLHQGKITFFMNLQNYKVTNTQYILRTLSSLTLISIKYEVASSLNYKEIICSFVRKKARFFLIIIMSC